MPSNGSSSGSKEGPSPGLGRVGEKRSDAAIQRRKHKARAQSKVKKLRAQGATVPRALALAARPARGGTPKRDKTNGLALKLLAAGQGAPRVDEVDVGPAGSASARSIGSASSVGAANAEWCRRGVVVRFTNRRAGEIMADPDSDSEVKLKWLDDGQESGFVPISQLEYVAADVEEYVDDGEGPVRKPHKKAARKAAREAAGAPR